MRRVTFDGWAWVGRFLNGVRSIARILFGNIVSEARGKLGGVVFSRNTSGAYARQKVSPVQPRTPAQLNQRSRLTAVSKVWETLTQNQREAWKAFSLAAKEGCARAREAKVVPTDVHVLQFGAGFRGLPFDPEPAGESCGGLVDVDIACVGDIGRCGFCVDDEQRHGLYVCAGGGVYWGRRDRRSRGGCSRAHYGGVGDGDKRRVRVHLDAGGEHGRRRRVWRDCGRGRRVGDDNGDQRDKCRFRLQWCAVGDYIGRRPDRRGGDPVLPQGGGGRYDQ